MAKKPTGKKGDYRDFILGMRDQINRRVNSALGRFPNYRVETLKVGFEQCFRNLFDANTKTPQQNFSEIFDALLNLFLLAVGHNYYAGSEIPIRQPYLDPLFNTIFPSCLPLLSANPHEVPAMLFNACEYVGERSGKFLDAFMRILQLVDLANFEKIIQILLWWLGDPRRRQYALTTLEEWPEKTRTELSNKLVGIECDSGLILEAIRAMKQDPWINPREYLVLRNKVPLTRVASEEPATNPDNKCRLRYGSFTGFNGIYDAPPKIAGNLDGHLITYTPMGKLFFSMLDGIGSWEKIVPIPLCTKVVHPTEDTCFGITPTGTLLNLRSGEKINVGNVKECVDIYANNEYLFLITKSNKSLDSLLKFHIDWAKNPTQLSKRNKKVTDPISSVTLSSQPYHLATDPDHPDDLLLEVYKKESMDFQLIRATVNENSEIKNQRIIYKQTEPYLFSLQDGDCHIIHADGTYTRFNAECSKEKLTLKLHGLHRPTSLLIKGKDIFATSSHSFHLFGFLNRPPDAGVPAEINLISRS